MTVAHCRTDTDTVTGEQFRARIEAVANRLYRQDGGRDGRDGVEPRSWDQLRHDALMTLLGIGTSPLTNPDAPSPDDRSPDDRGPDDNGHEPGLGDGPVLDSDRGDSSRIESALGGARVNGSGSVRNQIVVVVDAEVIAGTDPNGLCEMAGTGAIATSVLERLACDADLYGHIFSGAGVSLWHGRATRTTSPQQWRALVTRDRGCVICAAHPAYCEAHHLIAWAHGGNTDIENLALVCTRHHHQLHDTNQILIRDGPNWHTRPAPSDRLEAAA